MFEVRAAGALLAAVSAARMGIALGSELRRRVLLLQDFYKGILMVHQEMDYMKTPLEEALQRAGTVLGDPLSSFFRETGVRLEKLPGTPFFSVWEEMEDWYLSECELKEEDRALIMQWGMQLGNLEPGGNGGVLKVYRDRLEKAIAEAEEEHRSKARLYERLGVLGGIFLVILFL